MLTILPGIKVMGIASALPSQKFSIDSLSDVYSKKKIERLKQSTGVESVRIATDMTASDLCADAAKRLLDRLHIAPGSIDGVLFVSQTLDYIAPSTSIILQERLQLSPDGVAFDLNFGCSGYGFALYEASLLLQGGCNRILICAGDTISRHINKRDYALRVLMGDAGTATLVERGERSNVFYFKNVGSGYKELMIPAGGARLPRSAETAVEAEDGNGNWRSQDDLYMDGMSIMNFALREVPQAVHAVLEKAHIRLPDLPFIAMHQPNKLILRALQKLLGLSDEQLPIGLQKVGNTGPASIPLLLNTLAGQGRSMPEADILVCGFGIGLSVSAASLSISNTKFIPIADCSRQSGL